MLTIAVCDDDQNFISLIEKQLDRLCFAMSENVNIQIRFFHCARDVLQYLTNHKIQILFLDIRMPDMDGFALAESLYRENPEILTVFVSSHEELVYDSIRYRPFRFVRKNRLEAELPEALQASLSIWLSHQNACLFHTIEGDQYLLLKHLLYLESQKNYVLLHCLGTKCKCRGSLSEMEALLINRGFYRIHTSFLINMEHIKLIPSGNTVTLTDGTELAVSRNKMIELKDKYIDFLQKRAFHDFNCPEIARQSV